MREFANIGQVWRCRAVGYIGLYRGGNVKARALAVHGPYALMLGWGVSENLHKGASPESEALRTESERNA